MNLGTYTIELSSILTSLPADKRSSFITAFQASEKNPTVLFGFNIWLGWLGIDRFLVGDVVAGVFKLITLGGFGIWQLIDCFLIGSRARSKNIALARQLTLSFGGSEAPANPPTAPSASEPE